MSAPLPDQLADDLCTTYAKLRRTLALLDPHERNVSLANGWTPKALLAHVAFWDRVQLARMEAALDGSLASGWQRPSATNDERALLDLDRTWDEIEREADAARQAMIGFVRSLRAEQVVARYAQGDGELALEQLIRHMAAHALEHSGEVWRFCGSMQRWSADGLRALIEQQHELFMDAIGGLSEETISSVPLGEKWTARDLLVHVLAWKEYLLAVLRGWPEPDREALLQWTSGNLDGANERLLHARDELDMIGVVDELATVQRRILTQLDGLDAEALSSPGFDGWNNGVTLAQLVYRSALHEAEHAAELWNAREADLLRPHPAAVSDSR